MTTRTRYSITLSPGAVAALEPRCDHRGGVRDRSAAISTMLERYALLCQRDQPELSDAERSLIRDSLNGCICWDSPWSVLALEHQIQDAIQLDGLADTWEVDGDALVARIAAMSYAQKLAVIDDAERLWIAS